MEEVHKTSLIEISKLLRQTTRELGMLKAKLPLLGQEIFTPIDEHYKSIRDNLQEAGSSLEEIILEN